MLACAVLLADGCAHTTSDEMTVEERRAEVARHERAAIAEEAKYDPRASVLPRSARRWLFRGASLALEQDGTHTMPSGRFDGCSLVGHQFRARFERGHMTLLLIALGVAMDAAAVSGSLATRGSSRLDILKVSLTFGIFQFGMSLMGALGGAAITLHFSAYDHWVAFGLLVAVGGKMLWGALAGRRGVQTAALTLAELLALGVATSIDALAVGVTLPALGLGTWIPAAVIGVVTWALSAGGAWVGGRAGGRFGPGVEILGGLVLMGIGVKTLLTHHAGCA